MEMTSVVSFVRFQWLGHMWRRSEDDINRIVLEWKNYEKKTSRTTKKNMVRCTRRGPEQNRSSRLEITSPGQGQMEGFNDGSENS